MDLLLPKTDEEAFVSSEAIGALRSYKKRLKDQEEFLKTKKFQMGTIVVKRNMSVIDGVFSLKTGAIGKVVGYDLENNYYRVFFNNNNPYIGIEEEHLDEYDGDVPEIVIKKDPWKISMKYFSV